MQKVILVLITLLLIGCTSKDEIVKNEIFLPNIEKSHTLIKDDSIESQYILNKENYIKPYNDMAVPIENINSGDMILSSILNFTRTSSDDKFGILQPDKIFSNLVNLKYLELPISNSHIRLALLEQLGYGQIGNIEKVLDIDKNLILNYYIQKNNDINSTVNTKNDDFDFENEKYTETRFSDTSTKECKNKNSFTKLKDIDNYHDRSMASTFAKNSSNLTGFTTISKYDNLGLKYVQTCIDENETYSETFSLIKETLSELITKKADIVSMSIGLFDDEEEVLNFLKDTSSIHQENIFENCVKNGRCFNNRFMWVISLGNLDDNSTLNEINSTNEYDTFKHTKFITTVTGVVNDRNNSIVFTQQGQQFKNAKKEDIDYFSINLPKKTLLAYDRKELKFKGASTSYATAIFSAISYNLYSLNPDLDERGVTRILQKTAYNNQCEIGTGIKSVKYNVGGNKKFPYDINCSTHRPSRVGYIVNMKEAYKEAVKQLIETHNYFFFSEGDVELSLYRDDSEIEKTKVIDENSFLVSKIKISDKNFRNMNLGEASIVDNMVIDFSKDKIVCRYKQKFDAYDGSYSDITYKEVTLKYKEDGRPFIAEERNLFSE